MCLSRLFLRPKRVIIYVDGFNLYFGMRSAGIIGKWLDLRQLAENLIKSDQKVVGVKYFTSAVSGNPAKEMRQRTYLEALKESGVQIYYGKYTSNRMKCRYCGGSWIAYSEKMTDVNIATEILHDAYADKFDVAILVSGDSDLVPPVKQTQALFPKKKIVVAFPPQRKSKELTKAAKGYFTIGRSNILASQFPASITKKDGHVLRKPATW